jgi:RNA polymerase sporulation-specific sigma factor
MELTKEHLGLIEYQLSTLNVDENVEDDLRSVGHFGLLNALRTWDSEKSAGFKTYASVCIRNAMLNELRHIMVRDKRVVLTNVGYERPDANIPRDKTLNPEELLLEKDNNRVAWQKLMSILPSLSNRQKYILRHRIHCEDSEIETQAEIASRFKCNQSTIQREEKTLYENLRQTSNM